MLNVCGRCKRPMSSHDNHASCPQCRIAAGECNLDVHDPCSICGGWTSKQWSKLRRSLVDARARASQRGRQHWTTAFPQLEACIMSRPALSASSSGPASEISSLVSGDDFSDRLLVSTLCPLAQQDLVVQTQNGVNMSSGTATTAPSTAPLPLTAGPSTIEPIVAPLGAQWTRPVSFKELGRSLVLSRQCSLLQYTAPCRMSPACRIRHPCRLRHPCRMLRIQHPCHLRHPCHACYVSKAFFPNGLLWSGQSVPSYA